MYWTADRRCLTRMDKYALFFHSVPYLLNAAIQFQHTNNHFAVWHGILRPSHTAQNSRKRMNHAQISSLTWYISDLRISSVFLTWNLRSCAPMFAVSVLYAIPGFEQLKTRLRVKVCAVLRCFTYFMRSLRSPYADNARNVRGISVIVCENVAAIVFVDDFPLTISRHMTHVSRLLHLSITENHWKKIYWRMYL